MAEWSEQRDSSGRRGQTGGGAQLGLVSLPALSGVLGSAARSPLDLLKMETGKTLP